MTFNRTGQPHPLRQHRRVRFVSKTGGGTVTLSAAGSYSGTTTISAGTLAAGIANALPSTTALTIAGNATFNLGGFNQSVGSVHGGGSVSLGSGTLTTGGDNTDTTLAGVISGSGGLTKVGTGTFTLSNNNTYPDRRC